MKTNVSLKVQQGFTLVEILVSISIAAILLGVGVPSFVNMIQMNSDATRVNQLLGDIRLARIEAIKRRQTVQIVPSASGWTNGWIVEESVSGNVIKAADALLNTSLSTTEAKTLVFDTKGETNQDDVYTLVYERRDRCPTGQSLKSKINITVWGRVNMIKRSCS